MLPPGFVAWLHQEAQLQVVGATREGPRCSGKERGRRWFAQSPRCFVFFFSIPLAVYLFHVFFFFPRVLEGKSKVFFWGVLEKVNVEPVLLMLFMSLCMFFLDVDAFDRCGGFLLVFLCFPMLVVIFFLMYLLFRWIFSNAGVLKASYSLHKVAAPEPTTSTQAAQPHPNTSGEGTWNPKRNHPE